MKVDPSLTATTLYTLVLVLHSTSAAPIPATDCHCASDKPLRFLDTSACDSVGATAACKLLSKTNSLHQTERVLLHKSTGDSSKPSRKRSRHGRKTRVGIPVLSASESSQHDVFWATDGDLQSLKKKFGFTDQKVRTLRMCAWEDLKAHTRSVAHLLLDSPEKLVVGGVFCFFLVAAVVQSLREAEAWSRRRRNGNVPEPVVEAAADSEDELSDEKSCSSTTSERRRRQLDTIQEEDDAL